MNSIFRMSFTDFLRYFEKMEICNLGPEVMDEVCSFPILPIVNTI